MTGSAPLDPANYEVVIVTYRSRDHVATLLASWPTSMRVAVVDNSGNVDGMAELTASYPSCRYLDGGGVGFARAANIGAFSSSSDVVIFVNPDTRPTVDDLNRLAEGLVADPTAISHAATVTGHDGDIELGVGGWEPTVRRAAIHAVGLHKRWPEAGIFARPRPGETAELEWTTGACMAVKASEFRTLAGFDELFYVYAEDMSFGRRARLCGLRQVLRADVVVAHGAGGSGAPSTEMMRLRGASFAYYMQDYHSPVRFVGVIGATIAGYAARAADARRRSNRPLATQYTEFIKGMVTRRAMVGGQEVARRRRTELRSGVSRSAAAR